MAKIGLLGGTFDPIHYGHLIIAEAARDALGLSRVEIIPTNTPPHKVGEPVTSADVRAEMVRLAIDRIPDYRINPIEMARDGRSFTVDTLEQLQRTLPDDELVFIVGSDSLRDLPNWRNPSRILELAELAVINRPGVAYDIDELARVLPRLSTRCRFVDAPLIDISSTRLRELVGGGRSIRFQTPPSVIEYIERESLYRPG